MMKTIVSSEGQIDLGETLRKQLNFNPGTQLEIDVQEDSLVLRRLVSDLPDWRTMEGMARGHGSLTEARIKGN